VKAKSEAHNIIINFNAFGKIQFENLIKIIRTDNGVKCNMKSYFDYEGIVHQTTCVEPP